MKKQEKVELRRMGQAGFLVKGAGMWLGLDLYLSDHPGRVAPSIVRPEELDYIDILFGSHDHPDHIDREAWIRLFAGNRKVEAVVPKALQKKLGRELAIEERRLHGLEDGESISINGIQFTGVASAHEFLEKDPKTGNHFYMGTVINMNGFQIYHPGDTCIYEGLAERLRKFGTLDVMILPINGRDGERFKNGIIGNMTYQEAVDLAGALRPGIVIPCHYDMFYGNLEDPNQFTEYLQAKYPKQQFWTGEIGASILFGGRGEG